MAEIKPGKGKFKVVRAAAVVRTLDGSERYLYKGSAFDASQADVESVKHLLATGVIEKLAERGSSAAEKAADAKAKADAAAKAEQDQAAAAKAKQ